jgi:hypothetical protein
MKEVEAHSGGGKETRTPDFQLAKLALYQLSYTPMGGCRFAPACDCAPACSKMVGLSGLEPLTSRLSGVCSNHLSYKPPWAAFCSGSVCMRLSKTATSRRLFILRPAPIGIHAVATQQQQRREGLSYFLYGSWRLQMDWKPVNLF